LWAERFDRTGGGARAGDRLVDTMAARIESRVQRAERELAAETPGTETARELYRQARARLTVLHPDDNALAMALLDRALALEPDNVALMAAACEARATRISMGWPIGADDVARCADLARRGLRLSVDDADAHAAFGFGLFRTGDLDFGLAVMQRAVEMNPNCLPALIYAGTASMHWGKVALAEAQYRRALRLAPHDPGQTHVMGGLSRIRMMQGRFEEALRWSERALLVNQNYGGAHWSRVAASAQLGRMSDARRHLTVFQRTQPGVTIAGIRTAQPTRANRMAATLEGLERAGLALAG
jgi:tetratricopeptide (TPR) repeat protein